MERNTVQSKKLHRYEHNWIDTQTESSLRHEPNHTDKRPWRSLCSSRTKDNRGKVRRNASAEMSEDVSMLLLEHTSAPI